MKSTKTHVQALSIAFHDVINNTIRFSMHIMLKTEKICGHDCLDPNREYDFTGPNLGLFTETD